MKMDKETATKNPDITERNRAEEALNESHKCLTNVLDSLDSLVYVVDFNSYEILFINKYGHDTWGDVQGRKCWQAIQKDQKGPCSFCTNDKLVSDTGIPTGVCQWEFQNTVNGRWYECRDQAIPWTGKALVRMEIATDITERKQAEAKIKVSEENYRTLIESASDQIFMVDKELLFMSINSVALSKLRKKLDEVIGKPASEVFPKEMSANSIKNLETVFKNGKDLFIAEELNFGGNIVFVNTSLSPVKNSEGEIVSVLGVVRDITERKKVEEALRESEEKYRTVIEQSIDGIVITDEYGDVAIWNKSIVSLTGIQQWDTVGKPLWEVQSWLIPDKQKTPELLEQLQRMTENILKLRVDWPGESGEKTIVCADGTRKVVHVSSFLIKADNTLRFGSILRDITAHRRAEEALLESEARYRLIAENMADTVWLMDLDLKMTYISPSAVRTRGYTLEELNDMLLDRQITPESFELVMNILKSEMMLERLGQKGLKIAHSIELEFYRKDGTTFWAEVAMTLLRDADGNPTGMLGVGHDITERKKAEEALGKSEERFRIAAESTSDCIWERDIKKDSVDWFGDIDSLLGYKQDEFPRTIEAWGKAIHPEDRDRVMVLLYKHIIEHTPYDAKYRVVKKDGSIAFWVDRGTAVYDENGKIYKMFGVVKDITKSESMKEALIFSNIILRTQQEASIDGILVVDEKGGILSFNQRFVDMWGIPPGVIESKSDERALQSVMNKLTDPEEFIRKVQHLYANQQETSRDEITLKGDRFFDRYSVPMLGEDGKYYGRVWYFRDITEHKRAVEDLVKYKDHLEELAKDRTRG